MTDTETDPFEGVKCVVCLHAKPLTYVGTVGILYCSDCGADPECSTSPHRFRPDPVPVTLKSWAEGLMCAYCRELIHPAVALRTWKGIDTSLYGVCAEHRKPGDFPLDGEK